MLLAAVSASLLAGDCAATAEVQVDGRPDAVHIEARDATLHDVLAALHDRFNLRYRTSNALETQTSGVFDGPLSRVAARLLDGYDYAMRITPDGVDLLVLGRQQSSSAVVIAVTPANAARPPLTAAERRHYENAHLR
ncbi:hypothetical protein [Bradyrhizobium iriomotense]|uniref:Secretin/TonB short N-terminal domain-containing protein n=1 Tax=Bradyrhizobium iriomotense TaxID=441950 RepID=A0ABQ6AT20_9BRAD|nr:hypothetical protein [Bradyrhizobium iriomotense]GLR85319.1 hypothetical protein GCM10007857_20300 [Bradyrhizobium iriomotense]